MFLVYNFFFFFKIYSAWFIIQNLLSCPSGLIFLMISALIVPNTEKIVEWSIKANSLEKSIISKPERVCVCQLINLCL